MPGRHVGGVMICVVPLVVVEQPLVLCDVVKDCLFMPVYQGHHRRISINPHPMN